MKKTQYGFSVFALVGVCLSLTSMASFANLLAAAAVNIYAFLDCIKTRKQGRKISLIGIIITLISLVLCISTGLLTRFSFGMSIMSFLISLVLYIDIVFTLRYLGRKRKNGEMKPYATWVKKYGKPLFPLKSSGFGKTRTIVVDSRDGTPYLCERNSATLRDRAVYTAEELGWKEVRRFAEDSLDEEISNKFAEVDADNWFMFTKN